MWRASKHDIRTVLGHNFWLSHRLQKKQVSISRLCSMYSSRNSTFGAITIGSEIVQTIELLIKGMPKLQTTLRHIEMQNHWTKTRGIKWEYHLEDVLSITMKAGDLTKAQPATCGQVFFTSLVWLNSMKWQEESSLEDI